MNKDLRTGLILVGVVVAVLVLAFAAQAAGLTQSRWTNGFYGGQMARAMQGFGGMGGMMSGGAFQYGAGFGHMVNFDQMPHGDLDGDGQPDCPYWQEWQEQQEQ